MTKPVAIIIEDDPLLSQIYSLTLQDDFDVHTIIDGKEAMLSLSRETPRLVILDLNLPQVSGEEILSFIRSNQHLKNTSVILCTANERLADTLRNEADLILLKPVSPIQLKEIASRLKQKPA